MKFGEQTQILFPRRSRDKLSKFCKFKMADGRHIENNFLAISHRFIVRLTRNLVQRSAITFGHRSRDQNIPNFENSRWRTAAILKIILSSSSSSSSSSSLQYLSGKSSDFNEIWCVDTNVDSKNGHVTKYRNFANSKWLTAAILKIVISYILTIYCPINAKFGIPVEILNIVRHR